jgi:DNA modification methylase
MKTETLNIESLIPYAKNSRTHSAEQVAQIASSIREFGWTNPVLIDGQGTIIAGHGRVMAARALNIVEIPCIRLTHLSESQIRAYVIADNKLALNAGWDEEMLNSELRALAEEGDIVKITGFSDEELAELLLPPEAELTGDLDEVPEPPVDPITKAGDLWILGEHRVLCGDSTKAGDVERLMAGESPFAMITDPPYGVNLDQSWRDKALGDKAMGPGNRNVVANDDKADWTETWSLFGGDVAYVWHASKFSDVVIASLRNAGFEICQQLIWNKSVMVMGRSDYHFKHEPCWYAVRKGRSHGWIGDRKQTTVIEAKSPNHIMSGSNEDKTDHPTQKPVECMAYFMRNHSGAVYDPFLGSGTTLIAAEQLGRKCYGIEISPAYCDVIVNRWQNATNKIAVHAITGKSFNDRLAA